MRRKQPIVDLSGLDFHELHVIEPTKLKDNGMTVYKCQCSCNTICYVRGSNLTSGNTKSCGHLRQVHRKKGRIDYTGQIIDDFMVDEYTGNDTGYTRCAIWKCHCIHCGKEEYLPSYKIRGHYNTKCTCRK